MPSITKEDTQCRGSSRRRRSIVVVDVVESVRLMHKHESDVIERWRGFVQHVRDEFVPLYGARLVKSLGDGLLFETDVVPRALSLAFALHQQAEEINAGVEPDRAIRLRCGIHVADIVSDDFDIYGDGVNVAARLAGFARPGGIAASVEVVDDLLPGIDASIEDAGLCFLKHIDEPVQVFHLGPIEPNGGRRSLETTSTRPEHGRWVDDVAPTACVALVPFALSGRDPGHAALAELVADLLLTRLSTVPMLRVISRLTSEQSRVRGLDGRGLAEHSGAGYLIGGRLHGSVDRSLLVLQLVDATNENVICAETVSFRSEDLLAADEVLTASIAQILVDRLVTHQLRSVGNASLPTLDSQALQFSAIHLMHRQALRDFQRAHDVLDHLIDRHPRASLPHSWMAKWHVLRVTKGWRPAEATEGDRALSHARRALDLHGDSALALAMEAFVQCHMKRDLGAARLLLADALALSPSEPWAWLVSATVEGLLGNGDTAWRCAMRASELSPLDPSKHYFDSLAASAAVSAQRYGDAERLAKLSLSKDARHLPTLRALAIAQVELNRIENARATMRKVLEVQPGFTLDTYIREAPRGGEEMRRLWARSLREAGAPEH